MRNRGGAGEGRGGAGKGRGVEGKVHYRLSIAQADGCALALTPHPAPPTLHELHHHIQVVVVLKGKVQLQRGERYTNWRDKRRAEGRDRGAGLSPARSTHCWRVP